MSREAGEHDTACSSRLRRLAAPLDGRCRKRDASAGHSPSRSRRARQGPMTRTFEEGSLHERIPQAMGVAIRDIDSGAAAVLPTVWLIVRRADGRVLDDLGTHGPPDREGCVEIGYSPAPSARPGHRYRRCSRLRQAPGGGARNPAAYRGHGAQNTASRRLLERRRSHAKVRMPGLAVEPGRRPASALSGLPPWPGRRLGRVVGIAGVQDRLSGCPVAAA